jgi:hypothetical protein
MEAQFGASSCGPSTAPVHCSRSPVVGSVRQSEVKAKRLVSSSVQLDSQWELEHVFMIYFLR